jgi:hypothetical protein
VLALLCCSAYESDSRNGQYVGIKLLTGNSYQTSHEVTRTLKYPVEGNCMQATGEKGERGKGRIKKEREWTDFKSQGTTRKQKTIR